MRRSDPYVEFELVGGSIRCPSSPVVSGLALDRGRGPPACGQDQGDAYRRGDQRREVADGGHIQVAEAAEDVPAEHQHGESSAAAVRASQVPHTTAITIANTTT
jgi:hypothetical protein